MLAVALWLLPAALARAETFTVKTTEDGPPGSLRADIEGAKAGDTIIVPAGTYGLTEELSIDKSLTILGAGPSTTTITAHNAGFRDLLVIGATSTVVLKGLTFAEGVVDEPGGSAQGGAIDAEEAALTLEEVVVRDSHVHADGGELEFGGEAEGGGVYAGGPLRLVNVTLSGDSASANGGTGAEGGSATGGGVMAAGPTTVFSGVTVTEGTVTANGGTGATSSEPEERELEEEEESGGVAEGAGAFVLSVTAPGPTLTGVTAQSDHAIADAGSKKAIAGGSASGGGLRILALGGAATLSGATVTESSAASSGPEARALGGGLRVFSEKASSLVANATIEGDSATATGAVGMAQGGGAYLRGEAAGVSLTSSTLDGNSVTGSGLSTGGGDLYAETEATVKDTIVSAGSGPAGHKNCGGKGIVSAGHNLDSADECGFHSAGDLTGANPHLGGLAANGGVVQTQALLAGSAALDAGAECAATDARGVPRPQGAACDIGAFEVAPPLVSTGAATAVGTTTATLNATASNASVLPGTFRFQYGPTAAHGTEAGAAVLAAGLAATPFSVSLTGLAPATTYHFQALATGPEGTSVGADQTFTTAAPPPPLPPPPPHPPALSGLAVSPSRLHAEHGSGASLSIRRGATISYSDSQAAVTTFTVQRSSSGYRSGRSCVAKRPTHPRHPKRCVRWTPVKGSFTHADTGGAVRLHFTGRLNRKPLAPGSYRLLAVPRSAAGLLGKQAVAAFTVIR
jgi:hypothetical protein